MHIYIVESLDFWMWYSSILMYSVLAKGNSPTGHRSCLISNFLWEFRLKFPATAFSNPDMCYSTLLYEAAVHFCHLYMWLSSHKNMASRPSTDPLTRYPIPSTHIKDDTKIYGLNLTSFFWMIILWIHHPQLLQIILLWILWVYTQS